MACRVQCFYAAESGCLFMTDIVNEADSDRVISARDRARQGCQLLLRSDGFCTLVSRTVEIKKENLEKY